MNREIEVRGRRIGGDRPVYIVAELSANHQHSLERAKEVIAAAKEAGADAVKFQTYTPDTMTLDSRKPHFRISGTAWEGRYLHELYRDAFTPWEWHEQLAEEAESLGLHWFSTPFDPTAVDFLEDLGAYLYKIASFENVDLPLLRRVAATGKPVIMSTGMATLSELAEAVATLREAGASQLVLLKCTTAYPAVPEAMNLRVIPNLAETFDVVVGLSDHSMEEVVPSIAVALGASVVEKHLTLSRREPGPDSGFSLEPHEFAEMVRTVRLTEGALGSVRYGPLPTEEASRRLRRSLFVVRDMAPGDVFTSETVRPIRPGNGLHTRHLDDVLGLRAACSIERGTPLSWTLIRGGEI